MAGLNKVMLIGHLGADPDIRRTHSGADVVSFRIATSESWKDKNTGERKEKTEWHSIVVFNENLARICAEYLKKGSKVYVEGQLQTRKWQDQAGADRYTTEIVLQNFRGEIQLLDRQPSNRPPGAESPEEYGQTRTRETGQQQRAPRELDDEIPF